MGVLSNDDAIPVYVLGIDWLRCSELNVRCRADKAMVTLPVVPQLTYDFGDMDTDRRTEWRRLKDVYAAMSSEELEVIAAEAYQLTDIAKEALKAELGARGAPFTLQTEPPSQDPEQVPEAASDARDPAPEEGYVVVCPRCRSTAIVFLGRERENDSEAKFRWRCDSCGNRWVDDGVEEGSDPGTAIVDVIWNRELLDSLWREPMDGFMRMLIIRDMALIADENGCAQAGVLAQRFRNLFAKRQHELSDRPVDWWTGEISKTAESIIGDLCTVDGSTVAFKNDLWLSWSDGFRKALRDVAEARVIEYLETHEGGW